jgi:hypothetical protein
MRSSTSCLALAALAILPAALVFAQPPSADVRTVALQWLRGTCGVGEAAEAKLVQTGAALVDHFLEGLEKGPAPQEVAEVERAAERQFAKRQEALRRGEGLGLSASDLEAARRVTRDEYVARARRDFDSRYRSQAISGLAIVDGPKAKATLQGLAKDVRSPLRPLAVEALARMARTAQP